MQEVETNEQRYNKLDTPRCRTAATESKKKKPSIKVVYGKSQGFLSNKKRLSIKVIQVKARIFFYVIEQYVFSMDEKINRLLETVEETSTKKKKKR